MKNFLLTFLLIVTFSCTENSRARSWGGTQTLKIKSNEEFINMAWKGNDLWVITKDTLTGTVYAREKSSYGLMQGKIIFK